MPAALPASIADILLGLTLQPFGPDAGNRVSLEGLTVGATDDGALDIGIAKFEAAALRIASGALVLEIARLALRGLKAQVRIEDGRPRLSAFQAASADVSGLKVHGPLALSGKPAGNWSLVPLAAADGTIRAKIVDAALLFDADVTVPVRHGVIDFGDATVEHVGPDSRMGVSRLGLYVDAPNGRSYLYQFASTPVAGVEYEQRGALLGPWAVTDRGKLRLQEFGEWMLRQRVGAKGMGFTEQARVLFERTSVSGDVQMGDGRFAAAGLQADLAGRAEGRNLVRLHSEAVGRGITVEMGSLSVRNAALQSGSTQLACDAMTGALTLRLFFQDSQLRFEFELASMKASGLRLMTKAPPI